MTLKPKVEAGLLFSKDAHETFMRITGTAFDNMLKRPGVKRIIDVEHPPFTKDELRADILTVLGGHEDGATQCRYCKGLYTITEIAADHAQPLSRGGDHALNNLDYPCKNCNQAKGSLTPAEFCKLIDFLEREIPLGRKEVLGRLAKAVSLAQGMRSNAPIINDLRKSGAWQQTLKARRIARELKDKPF